MSSPLEFVAVFREKLARRRISYLLTSGMACVHYGVQQLTKDSDWIIKPEQLTDLREMLFELERALPPWRISYRNIFGAPLDAHYLGYGWTSHLSIWTGADSPENHVDLFGKPPRLSEVVYQADGWATRDTVARMKKTDRAKDWPIVNALAMQAAAENSSNSVLHFTDLPLLRRVWANVPEESKAAFTRSRPLLHSLTREEDDEVIERLILIESSIWQAVNKERYGAYQAAWKGFYRRWREEEAWSWPTAELFGGQHARLLHAAEKYGLPENPLDEISRETIYQNGVRRAAKLLSASPEEIERVVPPLEELLP